MPATEESQDKLTRVRAVLDRRNLDAIVLRSTANAAWVSGGGRTHILAAQDVGAADIVVTRDGVRVVTAVNEADRLMTEELASLDAEVEVLDWAADRRTALPSGPRAGWDVADADMDVADVGAEVRRLRRTLVPVELDRLRRLGADAAAAMTAAARALTPRMAEYDAAAAMAREVLARGIDPLVMLVAGGDRLPVHRHPLPTTQPVGERVMLVMCARRAGLVASLTRMVTFGALAPQDADAYARLLEVDVAFNAATRPGTTVGEVFAAGTAAYAANGFAEDEWRRHHQGGPAGYDARDEIATAGSSTPVGPEELFAWNPSVPGLKSEDSVVTASSGPEVVTSDGEWPTRVVGTLRRPLVLEL
ncbi:MAG: M24 family metallopeptidase [Actinomycetota bacterium]|nr:M24 family metallopeptidase [Actinomycetota bacterium]